MADYKPKVFEGTAQTVTSSGAAITAGNFSAAPAAEYNNTNDASVPYAPYAKAVLDLTYGTAPAAGSVVSLYMVQKNVIAGSDDDTGAPSGTSSKSAVYKGSFPVIDAVTSAQQLTIPLIDMRGVNGADFYILNGAAQQISSGWALNIVPLTVGVTG